MPFNSKSNNRILPPNTRAVDVARKAIRDLAPIQQRKYANAFEVGGYESVVYTKLLQGMPCSCMAHRSAVATLLDAEGKLPQGTINQILTGGLEFEVRRYGTRTGVREDYRADRGLDPVNPGENTKNEPLLPNAKRLVDADYETFDLNDEVATTIPNTDTDESVAVNGPVRRETLDDVVGDFDTDLSLNESSCLVCYGSGFVGGYSVLGGWRACLSTQWMPRATVTGTIEANRQPHAFYATQVSFDIVIPKGFVYLDAFRFWNNQDRVVPDVVTIDNLPYSVELFAALCDGRKHTITVQFLDLTYFTHLEIQVCSTRHPAKIEFPKLTQGSDLRFEDPTEDVQINASPVIPNLARWDVIVESTRGKVFQISSATPWNDANRNVLGWDCNARVVQPSEVVGNLPRRRKLSQQATNLVRNNVSGTGRT